MFEKPRLSEEEAHDEANMMKVVIEQNKDGGEINPEDYDKAFEEIERILEEAKNENGLEANVLRKIGMMANLNTALGRSIAAATEAWHRAGTEEGEDGILSFKEALKQEFGKVKEKFLEEEESRKNDMLRGYTKQLDELKNQIQNPEK